MNAMIYIQYLGCHLIHKLNYISLFILFYYAINLLNIYFLVTNQTFEKKLKFYYYWYSANEYPSFFFNFLCIVKILLSKEMCKG